MRVRSYILYLPFIIALCLISNRTETTYADNFFPDGDIDQCKFASTTAVQYSNLGEGVSFDKNLVEGKSAGWIQSHSFNDVASIAYPNAARFPGVADSVSVPPGSTVEVGLFVWNYSGHEVNTTKLDFFTSQPDPRKGDLTRLGAKGEWGSIAFNNRNHRRSGNLVSSEFSHSFPLRESTPGMVFYEFNTIQPVQLINYEVTPNLSGSELILNHELTLENISEYDLCDIEIKQAKNAAYYTSTCLAANTQKSVTWEENLGEDYENPLELPQVVITDNNTHTESNADHYSSQNEFKDWSARSTYIHRRDEGRGGWTGIQPAWGQVGQDLIAVNLIPYSFTASHKPLNLPHELSIDYLLSTDGESYTKQVTASPGEEVYAQIIIRNQGYKVSDIEVGDKFAFSELIANNWAGAELINEQTLIWRKATSLNTNEEWVLEPSYRILPGDYPKDHAIENTALLIKGEPISQSAASIIINLEEEEEEEEPNQRYSETTEQATEAKVLAKTGENFYLYIFKVIGLSTTILAPIAAKTNLLIFPLQQVYLGLGSFLRLARFLYH